MNICMIPDANIAAMNRACEVLLCSHRLMEGRHRSKAVTLNQIVSALNMSRIDCQTRVRANRSMLEIVHGDANALREVVDDPAEGFNDLDLLEATLILVNHTDREVLKHWQTLEAAC